MNRSTQLASFPRRMISLCLLVAYLLAACRGGGVKTTGQPDVPGATATAGPSTPQPTPDWTPTPSGPRGVVSIWHAFNERDFPVLEEALASFQSQYPEVLFDVTYVPLDDLYDRFYEAAMGGYGPTLLFGPASWCYPLWEAGLLADLNGQVNPGLLGSLNPAGLAQLQIQGEQIGLPYALEGVVLYRNGFLVPEAPATVEQLISLSRSITGGEVIGAVLERSFFYSGGHLAGIGGEWIDQDGSPAFQSERGVAWVELLRQLAQAGPAEMLSDQDLELFKSGRVGFIIDATWNRQSIADVLGAGNLSIDPWPDTSGGSLSGFVQADAIYLNAGANAEYTRAALLFLEHFLSPENQASLAGIDRIPARTDLELTDRLMMEAIVALAGGAPYPVHPQAEIYPGVIDSALRQVFDEGMSPADALKVAEATILNTGQVGPPAATP